MEQYDVFISYSLKDKEKVNGIVQAFTAEGLSVYVPDRTQDQTNMIEQCKLFLVVSTSASVTDRAIELEARAVNYLDIHKLELKLTSSESARAVAHLFRDDTPISMGPYSKNYSTLISACKSILSGKKLVFNETYAAEVEKEIDVRKHSKIRDEISLYVTLLIISGMILSVMLPFMPLSALLSGILLAPYFVFHIKIIDNVMDGLKDQKHPILIARAHKNHVYTGATIIYILLFLGLFVFPYFVMLLRFIYVLTHLIIIAILFYLHYNAMREIRKYAVKVKTSRRVNIEALFITAIIQSVIYFILMIVAQYMAFTLL